MLINYTIIKICWQLLFLFAWCPKISKWYTRYVKSGFDYSGFRWKALSFSWVWIGRGASCSWWYFSPLAEMRWCRVVDFHRYASPDFFIHSRRLKRDYRRASALCSLDRVFPAAKNTSAKNMINLQNYHQILNVA